MNKYRIAEMSLRSAAAEKVKASVRVYPECILEVQKRCDEGQKTYYLGVKDTRVVRSLLISKLREKGFLLHTLDRKSHQGRAIDFSLMNPITGRAMTGSSSGTAINVFHDINDIGIGTDGGGSVLAPALSLNLYALISPLFNEYVNAVQRVSTDGLSFMPSLGFMAQSLDDIKACVRALYPESEQAQCQIVVASSELKEHAPLIQALQEQFEHIKSDSSFIYQKQDRNQLMQQLKRIDFEKEILLSFEGPIDTLSYGDTVMGHYDVSTQAEQDLAGKYFLKVANILGLSAIAVPSHQRSSGTLILFKSDWKHFEQALSIAEQISFTRSALEMSYFSIMNWVKGDGFNDA